PLMIFLKEATDLRFVMFNRAGEELLGYDRKDLLGKNNLDLFPPEQAAHFMAKDREALVRQGVVDIPEETIQTARKGQRILHTRKVSVLGSDGITKYLLGISEDITERKQAEEERLLMQAQLIQSQKLEAIGTLASGVAHEINNPIMGVMNYAQLILDILGPDSSVAEYAIEIGKETERVATIVKNLLAFSRKENQADSPARVSDIVKDTLSLIRTVMQHDQVYLEVDVPPDLPKIRCRSQQIQQVLMNLLTNARDALNEKYPGRDENKKVIIRATVLADGGRLTTLSGPMVSEVEPVEERIAESGQVAESGSSQSAIRITVEDHGNGIPEAVRNRIFDPFFTTKPRDKGTGLGLSISYSLVKEHSGKVTVESEVGQWTRFHVDLPVAECGLRNGNDLTLNAAAVSKHKFVDIADQDK
ncbi:MAG: ATP-binding protein, partial [bacterium]